MTGGITGTGGYVGGRSATQVVLEIIAPKMLQQYQRQQLAAVRGGIDRAMAQACVWPPQ